MGLRSLRVVNQLLHRWRSVLTSEERVQLMGYKNCNTSTAEEVPFLYLVPFSRLYIAPDIDGCEGPLLECRGEGEMDFRLFGGIFDRHAPRLTCCLGPFQNSKMAAAAGLCCVLRMSLGAGRTLGGSGLFIVTRAAASPLGPAAWTQTRHSSFFNKLTADELWRGVLAERGAGSRKGRGKRTKRKMKKDLNRGQNIGEGRDGFLWPGLNVPIIKDGTIQSFSKRGEGEQQELRAELERQRDEWDRKRKMRIKRERGWSGNCWGGISLGPPDPGPNGETYEDFDCRVIEVKSVFNMTAREGRRRSISALVAVGNGNGAAGFALGKATDRTTALRKAKNRAMHYLYYIPRYNHTIYHDVESTFKRTTLRIKTQNQGSGLHCHRAVITLCKLMGISDLYCKVEGSVNLLNITRALFQGLANQETHNTLADRKQLNVVEFSEERGPLPVVVARPRLGACSDPEVEDEVPSTKLHWADVQLAHGMKRSVWAGVKRTIW